MANVYHENVDVDFMVRLKSISDNYKIQKEEIPQELIYHLKSQGIQHLRVIPFHSICGLEESCYTVDLICDISSSTKAYRYMFESFKEAYTAILTWDGTGHPPGLWIKRKGLGEDLINIDYAHQEAIDDNDRRLIMEIDKFYEKIIF